MPKKILLLSSIIILALLIVVNKETLKSNLSHLTKNFVSAKSGSGSDGDGDEDKDEDDDDDEDNSGSGNSDDGDDEDEDDEDNSGSGNSDDDDDDEDEDDKEEFKTEERFTNPDGTETRIKREHKDGEEKVRVKTYDSFGNKIEDREFETDEEDGKEKARVKTYSPEGTKLSDFRLETEDGKMLELRVREGQEFSRVKYNQETGELRVRQGVKDDDDDTTDKITAEIEDGITEVSLRLNGSEREFNLNTTEEDEVIQQISFQTGLSTEEVSNIIEFETGENDIKVRARGNGFEITKKGQTATANFPLVIDEETGRISVNTSRGEIILNQTPDVIVEKARQTLQSQEVDIQNTQIVEQEDPATGETRLRYVVDANKKEKVLGIFEVNLPVRLFFDAQTSDLQERSQNTITQLLDLLSF